MLSRLALAADTRCPDTEAYSCPGSSWTLRLEIGLCVCYKRTSIDARNNWWGWNSSYFVRGRVWDQNDDKYLIPVNWDPYLQTNQSVITGARDITYLNYLLYLPLLGVFD